MKHPKEDAALKALRTMIVRRLNRYGGWWTEYDHSAKSGLIKIDGELDLRQIVRAVLKATS